MHRVLFQIGSVTIYTYGVCIALALVAAVTMAYYRTSKFGLNADNMFNGGIIAFIFGMLGAKLMYIIVELDDYLKDPSLLLQFGSGFVVYGGLIAGVAAFLLYFKIKKEPVLQYADIAIPAVSLGQAFGRVGCLMAGCCYGKSCPADAWYAIRFPVGTEGLHGVPLYPVQIICILLNLILCGILVWSNYKEKFAGFTFSLYMILYSFGRFFIEFLRDDPRGTVGPFSTSQFISIFTFAIGIAAFFILRWYHDRPLKVGGYPEEEAKDEAAEEVDSETAELEENAEEAAAEIAEEVEAETVDLKEAVDKEISGIEETVSEEVRDIEAEKTEALEDLKEEAEENSEILEEEIEQMDEMAEEILKTDFGMDDVISEVQDEL